MSSYRTISLFGWALRLAPLALVVLSATGCGCPDGLTKCGALCLDFRSDSNNCGACGNICKSGEVCTAGACRVSCQQGFTDCNGTCRDTQSDSRNCGSCGNVCEAGTVCSAGSCATSCRAGLTECSGSCRDLQTDNRNCGACGTACEAGRVCNSGSCAVSCQQGLTDCSGSCRDTQTDIRNCGACGTVCLSGEQCIAARCTLSCQTGFQNCNGRCVNPMSDNANCGTCGQACAAGTICSSGSCQVSCQPGLTECGGICVNTQTDAQNCGSCANACESGELCASGACRLSCQQGLTDCGGSCRDTQTDNAHCGQCARACAAGQQCRAGSCTLSCQAELTDCGGVCVNTQSDNAHCGECGQACPAGQLCSSGACVASCGTGLMRCGQSCVNVMTDPANCGACSMECPKPANADPICFAGDCRILCTADYADADGNATNGCERRIRGGITFNELIGSIDALTAIPVGINSTHDGGATIDQSRTRLWSHHGEDTSNGARIYAIDYRTNSRVSIDLPWGTHGSYPTFDGDKTVYVFEDSDASTPRNRAARIDVTTLALTQLPTTPSPHWRYTGAAFQAGKFYKENDRGFLMVYDPGTDRWTNDVFNMGRRCRLLANPGDGDSIYMMCDSNQLYRYSVSGNSWTRLADKPGGTFNLGANYQALFIPDADNKNLGYVVADHGSTWYGYSVERNEWRQLNWRASGQGGHTVYDPNSRAVYYQVYGESNWRAVRF